MRVGIFAATVVLAALLFGYVARDFAPPRQLTMAAGIEGGGYWRIAERYAEVLARDGVTLILRPTGGAVENAALLAAAAVDVGLVQGGVPVQGAVQSLGTVMIEPFLIFTRLENGRPALLSDNPAEWGALRFAVGAEGSGTKAAAEVFARAAGLSVDPSLWLPISGSRAGRALLAGEVDAAIFVAPLEAPYLARLFEAPDVALAPIGPLLALSRRMPQSALKLLPTGSIGLSPTVPSRDVEVIAMHGQIIARIDLHPALVDRLVEAAREVHAPAGPMHDEGRFPSIEGATLPLNAHARDLIENGPSPVRAWLPWWAAAQVDRLVLLLVPMLFVVLPLLRLAPAVYAWSIRSRIYRFYTEIREIEHDAAALIDADEGARDRLHALDTRLAAMDERLERLSLPIRFREYAYDARVHLDLVRRRIRDRLKA